jgi:hypothetical protein
LPINHSLSFGGSGGDDLNANCSVANPAVG